MKSNSRLCGIALVLSTLVPLMHPALAQGPLVPPGPPAPAMRTLQQVEPRTPISALPFSITNTGAYYLTTNLSGNAGITINASNVTLDLNGFSVLGAGAGSGAGIRVASAQPGVCIRNGSVRGWQQGVNATNASHSIFEQLWVGHNTSIALSTGDGCLIKSSLVVSNAFAGGISPGNYSLITGCIANGNRSGIELQSGCLVEGNTCNFNGVGVLTFGSGNRLDGNHVGLNVNNGIYVAAPQSTNNLIIRNSARGNNPNYSIQPNNALGAVVNAGSGITLTTNNPWANFSF